MQSYYLASEELKYGAQGDHFNDASMGILEAGKLHSPFKYCVEKSDQ